MRIQSTINSFTAGMLTPWLKKRQDLDVYNKGALNITNLLGRPFGGVIRRSGFLHLNETKTTGITRLMPFVYSITSSYVVELGAGYFRFYKDGVKIDYELANDYTEAQVESIHFAQSNDVIFITDGDHEPQKLSRVSDLEWTLEPLDFIAGPFLTENVSDVTIDPSGTTGSITLVASDDLFEVGHVGSLWSIGNALVVDEEVIQGYVKITAFTDATHVDAEVIRDLKDATATDIWAEGGWSDVRGYPKTIVFNDRRLILGNTNTEAQSWWGSEPLVYNNFDPEKALQCELSSDTYNSITGLASTKDLTAITYGAPFAISSGSSTTALTRDNLMQRQQGSVGGEFIQPIVIGSLIYFIQRGGKKLIQFGYSFEKDSYNPVNISLMSENLLEVGVKSMVLQKNEDNVLWMVMNDGKMVTLTLESDQQVKSFAIQETKGTYQSVASIPNNDQFWDDIYSIVKRTTDGVEKQYVELMTKPRGATLIEGNYLDSSVVYNGYRTSELVITNSIATSLVDVFTADNDKIKIDNTVYKIKTFTSATEVELEEAGVNITTSDWKVSKIFFDGLEHLEKMSVGILRDGSVEPEIEVDSGSITLLKSGYYVIIGLGYKSTLETFPIEGGNRSGSSQDSLKRIPSMTLNVIDTMGIKANGTEPVFLRSYKVKMGSPNELFTGDARVELPSNFETEVTLEITQESPLPMGILAITFSLNTQEI